MKENVRKYLEEHELKLLADSQVMAKEILRRHSLDKFEDFYEFMSVYGGDLDGKLGYMFDIIQDIDDEEGVTASLIQNGDIPNNYISLQDFDYEHYLLYDKSNNHVVLVYDANSDRLNRGDFGQEWTTFSDFLQWFFELDHDK